MVSDIDTLVTQVVIETNMSVTQIFSDTDTLVKQVFIETNTSMTQMFHDISGYLNKHVGDTNDW